MRIALVVSTFPKLSETFIVRKFLGLLDRGWDVHVVCNRVGSDWAAFGDLDEEELRRRVHAAPPATASPLAVAKAAVVVGRGGRTLLKRLPRYARARGARRVLIESPFLALRPDLVHFEFGTVAVPRATIGKALGCGTVASFRGFDLNFVALDDPTFFDPVWRHVDAVHVLGEDLWRRALARGCPEEKPHALIPPAVDAAEYAPPVRRDDEVGSHDRPLRVLGVGRLEWKKGYEHALDAVARLRQAGVAVEYRIVGGGAYLEAIAFCRHQLGLDAVVDLLGPQAPPQVRAHMAWADVLLHAAVSEGFGNAVLEAQAMELPIVTTDADGLAENVAHEQTGVVVSRRDAAAMADALVRLSSDGSLRRQFGRAGRARVARCFSPEAQLDAFEALYRQVGESRQHRHGRAAVTAA